MRSRARASRPPQADTVGVVICDPIIPADVPQLWARVRQLLEGSDAQVVVCDVSALVDPDLGTVDALARLQLTARRVGCQIQVRHACCHLQELLALVGLDEVVPCPAGSALEPGGQAEQREQPRGVQEEGDPGDPAG